jgi:hypothetical protein
MKIRYSMIGGGPGSFIGAVHRRAAWLDGGFDLVVIPRDLNLPG